MSKKSLQTSLLSTFALTVLMAATGCSLDADQGDLGTADFDALGDSSELEVTVSEKDDSPLDHIEVASKIQVAGTSDKVFAPGVSAPADDGEPEAQAPIVLSSSYLDTVVKRIRYATPTELGVLKQAGFLTHSLAGAVNLASVAQDPTMSVTYQYDADIRLLDITFMHADNTNKGSMACEVKEWKSAVSHERRFECQFGVENGESETVGKVNLSHELNSDSMRFLVHTKDYRDFGTTDVKAWLYVQRASTMCARVQSNHRIAAAGGGLFVANMHDVVQCDDRCQPNSGRIELDIDSGSEQKSFTMTGVTGEPWRMLDTEGASYDVLSCH
jgi:hypothetical protein